MNEGSRNLQNCEEGVYVDGVNGSDLVNRILESVWNEDDLKCFYLSSNLDQDDTTQSKA